MKSYSQTSDDVTRTIERMREEYYSPDLDGVTIDALFVFDLEATEPVLTHGGYPAQAVCRITPVRDRALGVSDAVIVIDRSNWLTLGVKQREALIDHELVRCHRAAPRRRITGGAPGQAAHRANATALLRFRCKRAAEST